MNTLTQRCEFGCCYLYSGKLSAYRYKVEATVRSSDPNFSDSMLVDFKRLKTLMESVIEDGSYLYDRHHIIASEIGECLSRYDSYVTSFDKQVSCESICEFYASRLHQIIYPLGMEIVEVKLRENSNSFVTFTPDSL